AVRSNRDEFALIIPYIRFRRATVQDEPLLVDTNIIIDGQIVELCATGFLSSSLIVPRCVLDELQRLADSADPIKRERGRNALLRLQQMQNNPVLSVTIHEMETDTEISVDTRLANLAKLLDVRLLTNDGNLCSIARLQGVTALNINDLIRALRPAISAGQHLEIALVKEGREPHQAVGYLADGTMIIVNHARSFLGKTAPVVIASAHQTSAGRLFFAELR
ncbi:MAG: PIN domain-containing protein, partial [Verrucomicrobiota bacterium]